MAAHDKSWVLHSGERDFRWRGARDVSRLESFSDVVFALTLTLLAVSDVRFSEVGELIQSLPRFILTLLPTYAILVMIWHGHYLFFRRYGLRDFTSALLNFVLLFVVLCYAYPLKIVFSALVSVFAFGGDFPRAPAQAISPMVFYSAGFGAIYLVFTLLYVRAWRLRDALELTTIERFTTRTYIVSNAIILGFAVVSIGIATVWPRESAWAGWIYFGMGPALGGWGFWRGYRHAKLVEAAADS